MGAEISYLSKGLKGCGFAVIAGVVLALPINAPPVMGAEGDVIDNSGYIPFAQSFFAFEVETPLNTLKEEPIWDELEQMLDNPYQFRLEPDVGGNAQGWPSYRSLQPRRRSYVFRNGQGEPCAPGSAGCTNRALPGHIIHPLNYNHPTGQELRLLNPGFEGLPCTAADQSDCWFLPEQLVEQSDGSFAFEYTPTAISPGDNRIEDDAAAIDFNDAIMPEAEFCLPATVDAFYSGLSNSPFFSPGGASGGILLAEGIQACGADPGEPGYAEFGVLRPTGGSGIRRSDQYSTPALPRPLGWSPENNIANSTLGSGTNRLFDPAGCAQRNAESPGSCSNNGFINRLRKPTLRRTLTAAPRFLVNADENLQGPDAIDLQPSNENDYYRGNNRTQKQAARQVAAALGKALFWDMQLGSDTVQACGSCHFHAGADNRTRNQTNPGLNGLDKTLQLHGGVQNADLVASDFPFATQENQIANDVASSMGVRFRDFVDIPPIGTGPNQSFGPADTFGVRTLLPDIGNDPPGGQAEDPATPLFQGLRRVEPRNTPTLFAAALNFDNFWDGRARHDFNGGSVFGPSDPQAHVFVCQNPNTDETNCGNPTVNFRATRQMIRFSSLASLATGPALSEFEMSFRGRNWAKIGKKLLQGTVVSGRLLGNVTPLANQLVDTKDSVIGGYSNQGGNLCASLPTWDRSPSWANRGPNKPGLCISYPGLIRQGYYPHLWVTRNPHLEGCYTDGNAALHPNQCTAAQVDIPVLNAPRRGRHVQVFNTSAAGEVAIPVFNTDLNEVVEANNDPFDEYVLRIVSGRVDPTNTNEFTHMEANLPLFFGLGVQAWAQLLIPDDTPFDRFFDDNPDAFATFGESGEANLALDLLNCGQIIPGTNPPQVQGQPCFTPVGNFERDPGVIAKINCPPENPAGCTEVPAGGNRTPGAVDPLMGMDFFLGSNLSLKNPNFRSLRCGECHQGGTLTDHTVSVSHQISFGDRIQEFVTGQPGVELFPEPLGRDRIISGFMLEGELQENAQDGIERNLADFCTIEPCDLPASAPDRTPVGGFPQGQALFDNGVYNIGVTPIKDDVARGGRDPFGWPLSLSYLALKNLCGVGYTPGGDAPPFAQPSGVGIPCPTFDPAVDPTSGGLFDESPQDQELNPGFGEEPNNPLLPPYLSKWASNIPVGDEVNVDEVFVGLNTRMQEPMLEGFVDFWGPFDPAAVIGENFNNARQPEMATWPNVNRVNVQGAFKAPQLRNVALTGPYFHNGGKLTLRQVVDFYARGADFPQSNSAHRDFLIGNMFVEDEALGEFTADQKEEILVSVVDFLLELTDERVAHQRAPFDQPEIFVPLDGTAPDNGSLPGTVASGRPGFLANTSGDCNGAADAAACFRQVNATGQGGLASPVGPFLDLATSPRLVGDSALNCSNNHYCH